VSAGSTIVDLHSPSPFGCLPYGDHGQYCYYPPGEIGPAILRPNGTVFATGSNSTAGPGHTAIYIPPAVPTDPGTWTPGPDFPNGDNAGDSFAALLPNGNVLVLGNSGRLYEFDGVTLISELFASGSLLVLPTGEVIVASNTVRLYTPSNTTYSPSWAPAITIYPATVVRGFTYQIFGKQFNGLSQAAAFGDELETSTNYPLVRITNQSSGHFFYARTHGHSTMAVATGNARILRLPKISRPTLINRYRHGRGGNAVGHYHEGTGSGLHSRRDVEVGGNFGQFGVVLSDCVILVDPLVSNYGDTIRKAPAMTV